MLKFVRCWEREGNYVRAGRGRSLILFGPSSSMLTLSHSKNKGDEQSAT